MRIKAVLFDHDGTLVDSEPAHCRIWQGVLARYDFQLSEQQYTDYYAGVPTPETAIDMVARFSIAESPELLVQKKLQATREFLQTDAFPLMPGARQIVQRFHSLGLRLAIVTGTGREMVAATTRVHELESLFETMVSGDDVERNKPHPDSYLLAMQHLGISPQECIAIEDTEHGLNAASAAGIPCMAIPNAMSMHHDFSRAAGRFTQLAEVERWVEEQLFPARY